METTEAGIVSPCGFRTDAEVCVPLAALAPANMGDPAPDNALLIHLSDGAVLDNLLQRYRRDEPYTYTGSILSSLNPCKSLPHLYTPQRMAEYVGTVLGSRNPPHLYAMAEEAYRLLTKEKTNQALGGRVGDA